MYSGIHSQVSSQFGWQLLVAPVLASLCWTHHLVCTTNHHFFTELSYRVRLALRFWPRKL